ncbi:sensor histidine kinase [Pseudomonas sp. ABFPK]|uniref:ATP-binding protein n=1 Tax=Pseudomonas sp. ABFPK TaxID=1636605 RepID=UPI00210A4183|nr:sensor histidine kinase [Pseudomonas sp. ABFPK]
MLSNLIGNALRHGDTTAPIKVTVASAHGAPRVSVQNSGEPITVEVMPYLFKPEGRYSSCSAGGMRVCDRAWRARQLATDQRPGSRWHRRQNQHSGGRWAQMPAITRSWAALRSGYLRAKESPLVGGQGSFYHT